MESATNNSQSPPPKPLRVQLDLAKFAPTTAVWLRQWAFSEREIRLWLDLRGWREDGGWWTAPSGAELQRAARAIIAPRPPK